MSSDTSRRATIYFEPSLHGAIRLKAAHTNRSVSEIVNDAVRHTLREDREDLAAFEDRVTEPVLSQAGEWTTYDKAGEVYKVTTMKKKGAG